MLGPRPEVLARRRRPIHLVLVDAEHCNPVALTESKEVVVNAFCLLKRDGIGKAKSDDTSEVTECERTKLIMALPPSGGPLRLEDHIE